MINNILIIQARTNSKRLKNKIFLKIDKKTSFLDLILNRLKKIKNVQKLILAVPKLDKKKFEKKNLHSFKLYTGPENNVMRRYYKIAENLEPNNIIRITSDCPFVDPKLVDKLLKIHCKMRNDYSCTDPQSFPDGQDVEIFTYKSFKKIYLSAKSNYDKEHVTTLYNKQKNLKRFFLKSNIDYSYIRITLDYHSDVIYLRKIYKLLNKKYHFNLNDIIKVISKLN